MNKQFLGILALVVAALIGLFIATGGRQTIATKRFEEPAKIQTEDHIKGNPDSPVTVVEYGDFQCPVCGIFFPISEQLIEERGEDIRFVYRHFPLTQIHPNAMSAHRAAEAAGNQGKFFEMHDILYENQQQWSDATDGVTELFETYAEQLELDLEQYRLDVQSEDTFANIDAFIAAGNELGVSSTPTVFVNDQRVETPLDYQALLADVDAALAEAGIEVEGSTAESDSTNENAEEDSEASSEESEEN